MDYCRRILAVGVVCLCAGVASANHDLPRLPLTAHWVERADITDAVYYLPTECLNKRVTAEATLGRLAFESPALLGGQSARMGLSCSACHVAGRSNPYFNLKGISGENGTADVSQSFLSSSGGNDDFTPKPIPDLAITVQRTITDRNSQAFRAKLSQLIEVEFDGQPALPSVFDALQYYLANIDQEYCTGIDAIRVRSWRLDWQRLNETVGLLQEALIENDEPLSLFLVRVARYRLENIYRGFGINNNKGLDRALINSSRALFLVVEGSAVSERLTRLALWRKQASELIPMLELLEEESAYSRQALMMVMSQRKKLLLHSGIVEAAEAFEL